MPIRLLLRAFQILSLFLLLKTSGTGFSKEPVDIESYVKSLIHFNSHTPVEPSWPHTGHHWLVGSSIQGAPGKQKNEGPEKSTVHQMIRQEWSLIKSLFYPIDTGISYAHFYGNGSQPNPSQINAWAQWTVWETFGWPAIAGRIAYSKTSAAWKSDIRSWTGGLQVSWGFKRITVWGGAYASRHAAQWSGRVSDQQDEGPLKTTAKNNRLNSQDTFTTLGLHLQIFQDFLNLAIERQVKKPGDHYTVKLSCLL